MKRWSLGFFSVAAFVATFGFKGLSPEGTNFTWVLCLLFLGSSGIVLIHRLAAPRRSREGIERHSTYRNTTPSSFARATSAWR